MFQVIVQVLLAGQAAAQTAPAPQAAPAKLTLQQRFDAASAAAEEGRCSEAVPAFEALETNAAAMRSPLVSSAVAVRKGICLAGGPRSEEAEAGIRRGLPTLVAQGANFAIDVNRAHIALGRAAQQRFDYASAAAEYRTALDGATGTARIRPLLALSQVLMFDGDGEAVRLAGEARTLAMADTSKSKESKATIAIVQTLYARALLNAGQVKQGYAELKDGLARQGGLDYHVNLADLSTRSDLAIAALLNKDRDSARTYLAYTGAGRLNDGPFAKAASMQPPICGGADGLKPTDFAIVEFSLDKDGHVSGVAPIYTTGGRAVALAFARAVTDWSWQPEAIEKVPELFRYATRVELRCTVAGERPALTAPLGEAYAAWIAGLGQGAPVWADQPDARAAPLQRTAVERATAAGDKPALLAASVALGRNDVATELERTQMLDQAATLADSLKAPVNARTYIAIELLGARSNRYGQVRAGLHAMLADPAIAADPLSAATLRLLLAKPGYRESAPPDQQALLDAVIAEPGLPAQHPLKISALLLQANMLAKQKDLDGARTAFQRTGLTEEQCSLLPMQPALRASNVSSNDYPDEALHMGFEGWVKTEFDVATNGTTIAPRVVVSYPPFVFDEAGEAISKGFRYASSYRPASGLACSARQESVSFRLP